MNERLVCMTVDLEPDFLSEDSHEVLLDEHRFTRFAETLSARRVPVSVFVVARMLDQGLPVRERFGALEAEFELHSYSHDPAEADSPREISRAKEAYQTYFGRDPRGYRAPLGFISAPGVRALAAEGFEFSASIFPSNRRELGFDHAALPLSPFLWRENEKDLLVEIPFAVSRRPRVVICESYLKLFGLGIFKMLHRAGGFPDTLVIDSHLYDFFETSPVTRLSRLDYRRHALLRNQTKALSLLDGLLSFLAENGYRFATVGEVHDRCRERRADLPRVSLAHLERTKYRVPPRPA
jgi:peptidoglycan/xylan/chitin deacetylase (PgdA/CDA1 family)